MGLYRRYRYIADKVNIVGLGTATGAGAFQDPAEIRQADRSNRDQPDDTLMRIYNAIAQHKARERQIEFNLSFEKSALFNNKLLIKKQRIITAVRLYG